MPGRAYWKGYLKLSLVSCPIALFPATSEREKISFHQLNKDTGHRIKYHKVDAETGDEVETEKIIKGYEVGKGQYIEIDRKNLKRSRSKASTPSKSTSLFPKKKSTSCTCAIRTTSSRTEKSGSKLLQ